MDQIAWLSAGLWHGLVSVRGRTFPILSFVLLWVWGEELRKGFLEC